MEDVKSVEKRRRYGRRERKEGIEGIFLCVKEDVRKERGLDGRKIGRDYSIEDREKRVC